MGFLSLLGVLFIGLKLAGIIAWSWLWVLCPLWVEFAIWTLLLVLAGIVFFWKEMK